MFSFLGRAIGKAGHVIAGALGIAIAAADQPGVLNLFSSHTAGVIQIASALLVAAGVVHVSGKQGS